VKVVFACVHNAGRSQMAAAFYNALSKKGEGISAGTHPGERVHPEVVTVMQEVGIDLSDVKPQLLTSDLARGADMLITMGCGEACPYLPGLHRDDWPLADPKGKQIDEVRKIRDEIKCRVEGLVAMKV
jgi:arsenate reductase (thioredoxin)